MKKLFGIFLLLLCLSSHSQDTSAANNSIKMAYNFTTVAQTVVFDNTMRGGGTLTLSASIADGGGRNPGDPITLKLVFYNSSNAVITTVQQAYTMTLGAAASTYSVSTANCGGSCTNVAYVSVQFYGKDGGYWAGNYGPLITSPSLTFNGGSNILYNPQFGTYSGNTFAQGWTSDAGWQNCALYSGSATCVIDNGASVNGGNYSATGGTTSGTAGGYVAAPTGPTVEGGTITQTNAPSSQVITSGGSSTAGYTGTQQTRVNTWTGGSQSYNNMLYIDQTGGTNNNVTITQSGVKNKIDFTLNGNNNVVNNTQTGSNYLKEEIPGWGNNITINQSNTTLTNYTETKIQGNGNTVNHTQTGPGNHILFNTSTGDINTINVTQSGNAGHYAETKLTGNFNNVKLEQTGNVANKANIEVTNNGGAASVDVQQSGGKSFTIIQGCSNPAGCTTVVRQ